MFLKRKQIPWNEIPAKKSTFKAKHIPATLLNTLSAFSKATYILSIWCKLHQHSKCYHSSLMVAYGVLICLEDNKEQSLK